MQQWMDNHRVPRHRARNWANFWTTANSQKKVKFVPPDWITQGEWNWLTHFDAEKYMFLFLEQCPSFIQKRSHASLILQNWCHRSPACCSQGNICRFPSGSRIVTGNSNRIEHSRQEYFWMGLWCHQHAGKFHLVAPAFFVKPVFSCETWRASLREKSEKFHEINLSYQSFWKNSISTQKSSLCQMLTLSRNLDSNLSISFLISATEVFAEKKKLLCGEVAGTFVFLHLFSVMPPVGFADAEFVHAEFHQIGMLATVLIVYKLYIYIHTVYYIYYIYIYIVFILFVWYIYMDKWRIKNHSRKLWTFAATFFLAICHLGSWCSAWTRIRAGGSGQPRRQ